MLRHVRLLRVANGVLRPTKAATNEDEIVRRLRSWFAPQEYSTMIAERAVALLEAHGSMQVPQLAAEVYACWATAGSATANRSPLTTSSPSSTVCPLSCRHSTSSIRTGPSGAPDHRHVRCCPERRCSPTLRDGLNSAGRRRPAPQHGVPDRRHTSRDRGPPRGRRRAASSCSSLGRPRPSLRHREDEVGHAVPLHATRSGRPAERRPSSSPKKGRPWPMTTGTRSMATASSRPSSRH